MPQIVVADTLAALGDGARMRGAQRFAIPLIGVTGSNGKTTVKELTASILAQAGTCLATRGNLNNHIGVPLTLFRARWRTRSSRSSRWARTRPATSRSSSRSRRPTVGIITNAGAEHLEGFGSLEGAARAEGEMVAGLPATATAVINADDEFAALWRAMTARADRDVRSHAGADFTATRCAHRHRCATDSSRASR